MVHVHLCLLRHKNDICRCSGPYVNCHSICSLHGYILWSTLNCQEITAEVWCSINTSYVCRWFECGGSTAWTWFLRRDMGVCFEMLSDCVGWVSGPKDGNPPTWRRLFLSSPPLAKISVFSNTALSCLRLTLLEFGFLVFLESALKFGLLIFFSYTESQNADQTHPHISLCPIFIDLRWIPHMSKSHQASLQMQMAESENWKNKRMTLTGRGLEIKPQFITFYVQVSMDTFYPGKRKPSLFILSSRVYLEVFSVLWSPRSGFSPPTRSHLLVPAVSYKVTTLRLIIKLQL